MSGMAVVDLLQRLGLHALAERLLRQRLRAAQDAGRDRLHYRLALSLDAQGRRAEAAASYAKAIDSALAPVMPARSEVSAPGDAGRSPPLRRTAY